MTEPLDLDQIEKRLWFDALENGDVQSLINRCRVLEAAELPALVARVKELETALRYICQPTMGFPGSDGGPWEDLTPPAMPDPEWWVRNGYGTEPNIRLALATCIGMARSALAVSSTPQPEEPT